MHATVRYVMRNLEPEPGMQFPGKAQRNCVPIYVMQGFGLPGPFVRNADGVEMQIVDWRIVQTSLDGLVVTLRNQNVYFNPARSQMSCPVPTIAWLTSGMWAAGVRRKQNAHGSNRV